MRWTILATQQFGWGVTLLRYAAAPTTAAARSAGTD
jgi:hypothetical protein